MIFLQVSWVRKVDKLYDARISLLRDSVFCGECYLFMATGITGESLHLFNIFSTRTLPSLRQLSFSLSLALIQHRFVIIDVLIAEYKS
jgi:hypothetical protein